jgi:cysteine desulfurase
VNGETGALAPDLSHFDGSLFIDSTADHLAPLPPSWSTALWDSKSWRGPSGIAILAIRDQSNWRNPLPHNDHRLVPGGANPALIIASALAIEAETVERRTSQNRIADLNLRIRQFLINEIGDVDIASPLISEPQFLSFSFLYVNAEELVEKLQHQGFAVDSGSACISANIEPSHVLAAMGRLTHGNIRLHLWPEIKESIVDQFLFALKNSVLEIRTVK